MNVMPEPSAIVAGPADRFIQLRVTSTLAATDLRICPTAEAAAHAIGIKCRPDPLTGLAALAVTGRADGIRYVRLRIQSIATRVASEQDFDLQLGIPVDGAAKRTSARLGVFAESQGDLITLGLASVWPGSGEIGSWLLLLDHPDNVTAAWLGDSNAAFRLIRWTVNELIPS